MDRGFKTAVLDSRVSSHGQVTLAGDARTTDEVHVLQFDIACTRSALPHMCNSPTHAS